MYSNILIIRTSAIGDIIMASGIIEALKNRFPNACLTWMAEPQFLPLVEHHPMLDATLVFPKTTFTNLWRDKKLWSLKKAVSELKSEIRDRQFDLVIDIQGLLKSGIWAWFSNAPERIAFSSKEGMNWLMTKTVSKVKNHPDISSEYRQMALELGCDVSHFSMSVHYPKAIEMALLKKLSIENAQRFIVFCPFTTRPQKHWFESHWKILAELVCSLWNIPIYIIGGAGDITQARLLASLGANMTSLCGDLSLLESIALMSSATIVIGVDTGMTHAAISQQTPTIGLFGSTRPYLNTGSDNAKVLYLDKTCSPCRKKPSCDGRYDCMRDISPQAVFEQMQRLVDIPKTAQV